ncbi:MAG: glycosyl hydrolase-related protein [Chloroflexaceae bacterium]
MSDHPTVSFTPPQSCAGDHDTRFRGPRPAGRATPHVPPTPRPLHATIVAHTHWDRAWYLPFQVFRVRLVRLMERVIQLLDHDPAFSSFMLDGQMLPIADYLEVRPQRQADLERLVRAGRLQIGPWYALADEYLVSPEALVRNLMIGLRMAGELGGAMHEGYVPDAFGHIRQLPQILAGFGIGSALFWRGLGDEGEVLGNEFWWVAPDGSRVLAVHLRDGYHNAANLGYPMRWGDPSGMVFSMDLALRRLREAIETQRPGAPTRHVLLMNGIDHADPEPRLPMIIAEANRRWPDVHLEQSTLPVYLRYVREAAPPDLPVFCGELNRSRYAFGLQGVYSTRIYLKQANERVQTLLEHYAEPLSAWAWMLGAECSDSDLLAFAWRRLIQNHPHDDICGCSVDPVHREMLTRFAEVEQIATTVARNCFRAIAERIDRTAHPGAPFVLYNPTVWPRSETVEALLPFAPGEPDAGAFHLVDAQGQQAPFQVLDRDEHYEMEVLKGNRRRLVRVALSVADTSPCGYRIYYALPGEPPPFQGEAVQIVPNGMANRFVRLSIGNDGTLTLEDRASGRVYRNLAFFTDEDDAGDEYDYAPSTEGLCLSTRRAPARLRLVHAGPLLACYRIDRTWALPASLSHDRRRRSRRRVGCPLSLEVTLRHDSPLVELRVRLLNRSQDHRLRICFPTGIATDMVWVEGHFDVLARSIDPPAGQGWVQPPVRTGHQRGFVDLNDGVAGLAILSRGVPEYEVIPDGGRNIVALTLLRAVGWLSRGDLATRPAHAGVPCATPEAQCLGEHRYDLALLPHAGGWEAVLPEAQRYRAPIYLRRGDEHEGYTPHETWPDDEPALHQGGPLLLLDRCRRGELPPELGLLTLTSERLVLSAVKRSESGEALIVRCFNPGPQPEAARLRLFRPIHRAFLTNLNEEPHTPLHVDPDGSVPLTVGGHAICTIALH